MHVLFPDREFDGYIFDLDGTLIHSMPVHYRAWDAAFRDAGLREKLDEDLFYGLGGVPSVLVAAQMAAHYGIELDAEAVTHRKEERYLDLLSDVELIGPVVAFARKVAETKPVAIATGGAPSVALPALRAAGLDQLFKIVVTPEDVPPGRGKPAPDMFLEAARQMGVNPVNCVVFEDAEPGMVGARAAGMAVVHVPSRP